MVLPTVVTQEICVREIIVCELEVLIQIPLFKQLTFSMLGGIGKKYGVLVQTIRSCRT